MLFLSLCAGFSDNRNDPNKKAISDMSPYFNFGFISKQRAPLLIKESGAPKADVDAYIEEMIVRGELSDNFVYYTPDSYDSVDGAENWA